MCNLLRLVSTLVLVSNLASAFTRCIAHRGDSSSYLENSLTAISSAIDAGANGIEFDIHHSRDDVAFLMHDKTLERTARSLEGKDCPLKKKVKKLSWSEISSNCELINGEAIPTLENALQELESYDGIAVLEFKDHLPKQTLDLIKKYRSESQGPTYFITRESRILKMLAKIKKSIRHGKYYDSFMSDLGVMYVNDFVYSRNLPENFGQNLNFKNFLLVHSGTGFVGLKEKSAHDVIDASEIGFYTINEKEMLRKAFDLRPNFITTDRIENCLAYQK